MNWKEEMEEAKKKKQINWGKKDLCCNSHKIGLK